MGNMFFSRNFTALRKRHNLTQEQIAEKCCVSRQAVAKWEVGNSVPDAYKLVTIAEIFKVSVDELLRDANIYNVEFKQNGMTLDEIAEAIVKKMESKNKDVDVLFQYKELCEMEIEDDMPCEAYFYWGADEAEKGNYEEAISLFEEALMRGDVSAVNALISVYKEMIDLYAMEQDENGYYETKLEFAQKLQKYGKIFELELKKKWR